MVPALAFLVLSADPAARYDAFMRAHPTFAATTEAFMGGRKIGTGVLRLSRPRRLRFDVRGDGLDYSVSSTETAYIEVDRIEKSYDERPSTGGVQMYEPRLSPAQGLVPRFLLSGTAAGVMGGKTTVAAVAGGDEIRASVPVQGGTVELRLLIDPQGRPARYSEKGVGVDRAWQVTSFIVGSPSLATYAVAAPMGYVPFALPDLPYPLQVGEAAPLAGWRQGGKTVDLHEPQRGKPRLLAVLGTDCPASRAARPSLASLARTMPVLIIGPGEITDPSGTLIKRLSPPGTPMFYLVGANDAVKALWFGFDAAKAGAWEAEVRTAAK